ncbi:hypothetical protein GE061_000816 [Apolygus lucorum]|uniref:Uncharacterized protein n=1 Tax=Apolygus lucorum TaxID=248454 RepID=A0A8S9Y6K6_APOLU|nr:hypothetical protein GE061_000816 [Apolygus lucorum]
MAELTDLHYQDPSGLTKQMTHIVRRNSSAGGVSSYKKMKPNKSEEELKANRTFAQMSLDEQSEYLSTEIAERFCDWVKHTGMENLRINEDTLKVLFEVGMDNPSVRSLDVNIKELPTVPRTIAEAFRNYEKSERAALHRQILWDAHYESVPPKYLAFGKRHPESHKSWKKNVKGDWFTTKAVSEDIISGRALWGELLGTKVLKNYCKWLRHNPHYKRPQYLQKMGFLDSTTADEIFQDDEMDEEFRKSGRRNYWLFDKIKYLEEEENFKEELQAHPEILEMLKE